MLMKLYICMEICLSSRFMSIDLWLGMTHLVPRLSQNACCGWGAWCHSLSFETFPFGALFLLPSDLCQKLSLSLLYFNTTFLHNSSEWSSLITGPRLNSSPLKAKNPGIFHGSATTFRMKQLGKTGNDAQLWICLVVKVKTTAVKKNII